MKPGRKPRPFESFLARRENGCIEWTGVTVKSNGLEHHRYGRYTRDGKKYLAHRAAFERARGPIPPGMMVLHRCDNPLCCNPDHLFLGTHLDNMRDAMAKGRFRLGVVPPRNRARGSRNGSAKLSEEQVAAIRARRAAGETTTSLAAEYGVHSSVISRAARGLTFNHTYRRGISNGY